jgi:orotate phosphoribosyltransferase
MTDPNAVLDLFRDTGALLEGHFQLSSGLHSSRYLQCALVLEDPRRAEELGKSLAAKLTGGITTVVSPALGGLIIGHEVARALGVRHLFTERDASGHAVLRRGFTLRPGDSVVVIEDVVTTGLSTREVIEVVRAAGASVVAVGAIVDRSGGRAGFDVPFASLVELDVPAMQPEACTLCQAGQPVVKPGSRNKKA